MRAFILLMAVTLTTTASAAAPAYELVWSVGNALFRWRDGAADLVLRTKAPIDTVCAAKGGWIGFTSGGSGFLLAKGASTPLKLAGAARKGKLKIPQSCVLDGTELTVAVATEDYSEYEGMGESGDIVLSLPKGTAVAALVPKAPEASTGPSPGGRFVVREDIIKNKYGQFTVLRRSPVGATSADVVADMWSENKSMCGEDGCECLFEIDRRGWLPGDALWFTISGGCGPGGTIERVMPANSASVLTGDLEGSPDGRSWRIGSALCGPNGTCVPLPNQASDAVWTER